MDTGITPTIIRLINVSPRARQMAVTFEELTTLFETDPQAAEIKAQEIIDEYIESLDPERKQRARAYHWRIQQELRKFKDPQARLNRMIEMFWAGVKEFHTVLTTDPKDILDQSGNPSTVVKFPQK